MVDLESLGVVDAAERGAEMTLKHPATGKELDGKITVMGFDAEPVVQAARAFDRAEAKRTEEDREADTAGPMQRRNAALAKAAITGCRELSIGKKEIDADGLKAIIDQPNYVWIVSQVCTFGGARRNFFPTSSDD